MSIWLGRWRVVVIAALASFVIVFASVAAYGLLTLPKWPNQFDVQTWSRNYGGSLVIDQSGVLHVVYTGYTGDHYSLVHAEGRGDNWVGTSICTISPSNYLGPVSLATDKAGHAYICAPRVNDAFAYNGSIMYATNSGGEWKLTTAYNFSGDYRDSRIAVDSNGVPHIVFDYGISVFPAYPDIKFLAIGHLQLVGGAWSFSDIPLPANYTADYSGIRSFGVGPNGDLQLSYFLNGYGEKPGFSWIDIGETGITFDSIDFGTLNPPFSPSTTLARDSSGAAHVCYINNSLDSNFSFCYATNKGGSWNASVLFPTWEWPSDTQTSMVIDEGGRAHVCVLTHVSGRQAYRLVYANDVEGTWRAETVREFPNGFSELALAIDSEGRAHVSFLDSSRKLVVATNKPDPSLVSATLAGALYWAAAFGLLALVTSLVFAFIVGRVVRLKWVSSESEPSAEEMKTKYQRGV